MAVQPLNAAPLAVQESLEYHLPLPKKGNRRKDLGQKPPVEIGDFPDVDAEF